MGINHPSVVQEIPPRAAFLTRCYREKAGFPEVLYRLGALHQGQTDVLAQHRACGMLVAGRTFPHPMDVGPLLMRLFEVLAAEPWIACRSIADDCLIAAWLFHGILAIHPFENGNGRCAVDFAQFFLMRRWHLPMPPLALPSDVHHLLSPPLRALDGDANDDVVGLVTARDRLVRHFDATETLEGMRTVPELCAIADVLRASVIRTLIEETLKEEQQNHV